MMLFYRQTALQSITLLSLFQLIFSHRSADRMYSYLIHNSSKNVDAAFAFFVGTSVETMCERRDHMIGFIPNEGDIRCKSMINMKRKSSQTQINLFSFNLNDIVKGKKEEEEKNDLEENEDVALPSWTNIFTNYQRDSTKQDQRRTQNVRSTFGLSNLINVEALLLASQVSSSTESDLDIDPNTLLKDMIEQDNVKVETMNANNKDEEIISGINLPTAQYMNNAEDQLTWEALMQSVQQNFNDLIVDSPATTFTPSFTFSMAAEDALREATQSIELFLNDAASSVSPEKVQSLIASASLSLAVDQNADVFKATVDKIVAVAETLAKDQGVDVSEAAAQARATTKYTADFLQVANGVLVSGYVQGGQVDEGNLDLAKELNIQASAVTSKPLFHEFKSVKPIPQSEFLSTIEKGAEMALLSGAIYEDMTTVTHDLGQAIVANGTSADVVWIVSDKIDYNKYYEIDVPDDISIESPMLVRTITIRGFDASDENVDRERLLNQICSAAPVPLSDELDINVHGGLLEVAKGIYKDVVKYIDMTGPSHKIVLTGHSIGGSLANLILFLLVEERGAEFVNEKILRVYTYGSPPVTTLLSKQSDLPADLNNCSILQSLKLDSNKVYGFIQPWDPIARLFTRIDPLYPLIGDLGDDGVTLYASGPPRTLRPVLKTILENWNNWETFRDNNRGVLSQDYDSIGVQHILMPDAGRYLTDRLVSVNIASFPIDDVLRISSVDLCSALEKTFPLDTFSISLVPTAVRSFIHHFYPAYTDFAVFANNKKQPQE